MPETDLYSIPSRPGTYALVFRARRRRVVRVGRLGPVELRRGWYVYVGSAFGPGGLAARIRHHVRRAARPHWHLDYVGRAVRFSEAWCSEDPRRREHLWAVLLRHIAGCSVPAPGFGASDCRCASHLLFFNSAPSVEDFTKRLREAAREHAAVAQARRIDPERPSRRDRR